MKADMKGKQLADADLGKIAGGAPRDTFSSWQKSHQGAHIGKYQAPNYIGRNVMAVEDDNHDVGFTGMLLASREFDRGCGTTERMHQIRCAGEDYWISGDDYTLYLFTGGI